MALFLGAVLLRVNVAEVSDRQGESLTVNFTASIDPVEFRGDVIRFVQPLRVTARIQNTGKQLLADVDVRSKIQLHCDRCLEPVEHEISIRYPEAFRRPDQKPIGDEEIRESVYTNDVIDLTDGFIEQLLLTLPIKTLCNEACKGLCPKCGKNLNSGDCSCDQVEINPKMAKLAELLDKLNKE